MSKWLLVALVGGLIVVAVVISYINPIPDPNVMIIDSVADATESDSPDTNFILNVAIPIVIALLIIFGVLSNADKLLSSLR
jgi:hypothetical protein